MGILVVSVVVALLAARLLGGRFAALESIPIRGLLLLGAAVFCQILGVVLGYLGLPAGPAYAWALVASAVLVGLFIKVNSSLAGTELVALGLFLNALVIGVNGNMPVSAHAAERAGADRDVVTGLRHEPATSATRLRFLGEVIPVPLPVRPEVDSLGDLLIAAGMGQLVFSALRPYRRREPNRAVAKAGTKNGAAAEPKHHVKPGATADATPPGAPHVKPTTKRTTKAIPQGD